MYRTAPLPLINQIAAAFHPDPSGTILVPVNVPLPRTPDGLYRPSHALGSVLLAGGAVAPFLRLVQRLHNLTNPDQLVNLRLRNLERKRDVMIRTGSRGGLRLEVSAISRRAEIRQEMLVNQRGGVHCTGWSFKRNDGLISGATTFLCIVPNGPLPLSDRIRSNLFDSLTQFIMRDDPVPSSSQHAEAPKARTRRKASVEGSDEERGLDEVILAFVADPE